MSVINLLPNAASPLAENTVESIAEPSPRPGKFRTYLDRLVVVLMVGILLALSLPIAMALLQQTQPQRAAKTRRSILNQSDYKGIDSKSIIQVRPAPVQGPFDII